MLNDAADRGIKQSASSCMYPGPNVLYLCLCPHSKLLSMTIIWTSGTNFLLVHVQQHIAAYTLHTPNKHHIGDLLR